VKKHKGIIEVKYPDESFITGKVTKRYYDLVDFYRDVIDADAYLMTLVKN